MEAVVINHITSLQIQNPSHPSITNLPADIVSLLTNSPSPFGVIVSPNDDRNGTSIPKAMNNHVRYSAASILSIPHFLSGNSHPIFATGTRIEFASRCTMIIIMMVLSTASSSPLDLNTSASTGGKPVSICSEWASPRELARMEVRGS